ncbi:hypothetical protein VE04_09011, partial [Pseudogymnoascus sp. 24MN13]
MSLTELAQAVLWMSIAVTMLLLLCLPIKARELRKQPLTSTRFYLLHQLKISALIRLVHDKMMTLPSTMDVDEEAVTLMSIDVEDLK